ncbi:MAG TPA: hypothetical protein VI358_18115 [Pseudolabrys sp.]
MTWNKEADGAQRSHANRIITSAGGGAHSTPAGNNTKVKPANFKNGGRVGYQDGGDVEEMMEGEAPSTRLDRPSRGAKGKGATTVNVIIAPKPDAQPMPVPIPAGPPAPPPGAGPAMPPGGPGGAPGGMPPMMGRKDGGRVFKQTDDGAGSGPGRLEKISAYGSKAGKPAKSPKGD